MRYSSHYVRYFAVPNSSKKIPCQATPSSETRLYAMEEWLPLRFLPRSYFKHCTAAPRTIRYGWRGSSVRVYDRLPDVRSPELWEVGSAHVQHHVFLSPKTTMIPPNATPNGSKLLNHHALHRLIDLSLQKSLIATKVEAIPAKIPNTNKLLCRKVFQVVLR